MLGMNHTRGNALKIFTDLFTAATGRFNPDPVPILDAQVPGSLGVYFHERPGVALAVFFHLPVLRIVIREKPPSGGEYERIFLG